MRASDTVHLTGLAVLRQRIPRRRLPVAVAFVLATPSAWWLGTLAFAVRGGALLLAAPIVVVPDHVALSTLLTGHITTAGPSPELRLTVALFAGGLLLLAAAALLIGSYADLVVFERFARFVRTYQRRVAADSAQAPCAPLTLSRSAAADLVIQNAAVHAIVLLPALLAFGALVVRIGEAVALELVHPTSTVPLELRAVFAAREQVLVLLGALLVGDVVASTASRRLMIHRLGVPRVADSGARTSTRRRLARAVLRVAVAAVKGWGVLLAVLAPVLGAVSAAWHAVRSAYYAPTSLRELEAAAWVGLVTVVFVAVWVGGLLLTGLAAAVRSASWSSIHVR